jgi:TonB family protein
MNRLEKKCLIATAGLHLLLVLVLLFGSAFFTHHEKPDDTQLLDVIPANLIDAAFNSGVKNAQPPAPTPPQPIQPPTPPQPPQPKPEPVKQPDPEPVKPAPSLVKQVEDFFKPVPPKPEAVEPTEPEPKPQPHKIKVNLNTVKRTVPKETTDTSDADAAREAAKEAREAKKRAAAFAKALTSISKNASSATSVEMPGTGSVSYANYASVVKSVYERAWRAPDDAANDDAITRISVTIGSDGTVISSRILDPSGDSKVDASVQRTLDNVNFVAPFPDGAKEKEKTFIINFNLKAKRMLG